MLLLPQWPAAARGIEEDPAGQADRRALLRAWCDGAGDRVLEERRRLGCKVDDIVDALAVLWTAERIERGQAVSIPRDASGLPMEIVV